MFDFLGVQRLRDRLLGLEGQFHEMHGRVASDSHHMSQWIRYLHNEQAKQRPLSEEQVRTIVEKHAAFDIILARIKGIEDRMADIALPQRAIRVELEQAVQHRIATVRQEVRQELLAIEDKTTSDRQGVIDQLRRIAERVDALETRPVPAPVHAEPQRIGQVVRHEVVQGQEEPFTRLQHKLLKRIAKHPKPVVKSSILSFIQKYGQLPGTELREMVVEEQQLCSKSSFYRLLEELEKEGQIDVLGDGKEKTYADAVKIHKKV